MQSRYYDPQVGRFLNADGIIGANGGIMGYNMFAYCSNNPVMYVDPSGTVAVCWTPLMRDAPNFGWGGSPSPAGYIRIAQIKQTKNKLLYNQNYSYKYGCRTIAYNGCGPVAVHNAKVLLNISSSLLETANDMEKLNLLFLDGVWGTNPWKIGNALDYYNINYTKVSLDEMTEEGVYIVSYLHKNFLDGAHNVAVKYDGKNYISYNVNAPYGCHPEEYVGIVFAIYYLGK